MKPSDKRMPFRLLNSALVVLGLASCQMASLEEMAPTPVGTGPRSAQLQRGREIYITKCARCHSVEPVGKYTAAHWREIMPEMIEETNLNSEDAAAVNAYIFSLAR